MAPPPPYPGPPQNWAAPPAGLSLRLSFNSPSSLPFFSFPLFSFCFSIVLASVLSFYLSLFSLSLSICLSASVWFYQSATEWMPWHRAGSKEGGPVSKELLVKLKRTTTHTRTHAHAHTRTHTHTHERKNARQISRNQHPPLYQCWGSTKCNPSKIKQKKLNEISYIFQNALTQIIQF